MKFKIQHPIVSAQMEYKASKKAYDDAMAAQGAALEPLADVPPDEVTEAVITAICEKYPTSSQNVALGIAEGQLLREARKVLEAAPGWSPALAQMFDQVSKSAVVKQKLINICLRLE